MEMLNLLPNIALQSEISEKISRRYIPHNIRPQRSTYQYNRTMILNMQENDKRARQNCKDSRTHEIKHEIKHVSRFFFKINVNVCIDIGIVKQYKTCYPCLFHYRQSYYPCHFSFSSELDIRQSSIVCPASPSNFTLKCDFIDSRKMNVVT